MGGGVKAVWKFSKKNIHICGDGHPLSDDDKNPIESFTGLAVQGCKWLSTMVRRPTYAVLSRNQFCRELHAHWRGGSQKGTSDDEEEGGVKIPPKNDDVIYEQPLK